MWSLWTLFQNELTMASDLRMYYQDLVGPEVKAAHLDSVRNNYQIVGKSVTPQGCRHKLFSLILISVHLDFRKLIKLGA